MSEKKEVDGGVEWKLNERWGVGRDPYNWKLYKKGKTKWLICGYYGTAQHLLRGLFEHIALNEDAGAESIAEHLDTCLAKFDVGVRKLFAELGIESAGEMNK